MTVAIVDYGSGNLHSAAKAFERAARESRHDQPILVTNDPDKVRAADRVVLPGVGAFADCRRGLDAVPGMVEALNETVRQKGRPLRRTVSFSASTMPATASSPRRQSAKAPTPGSTTRSAARTASGSSVTRIGWS